MFKVRQVHRVFVFLELRLYVALGIKLKISVFYKCHQSRGAKIFPIFLKTISTYYLIPIAKGFSVFLCATFSEGIYAVMANNYSSVITVTVSEA